MLRKGARTEFTAEVSQFHAPIDGMFDHIAHTNAHWQMIDSRVV